MKRHLVGVCLAAAVVVGTGCGSSADPDTASSTSVADSSGAYSSAQAANAKSAGEKAAKDAGQTVKLPAKTIGVINIVGGIESADRVQTEYEAALDAIGWKHINCDGQGDPAKMTACGNSLLSQKVDAIGTIAIEPSAIAPVLKAAKDQGVPVFQAGGSVSDDPLLVGNYSSDDGKAGQIATDYFLKQLSTIDGSKSIAINDYPAGFAQQRTDVLKQALKSTPDVKVAADQVADAANLVEGTRKQVTDTLTANPDLKGYWFSFDVAGGAGAAAIRSRTAGKSFPDRPLVLTFNALRATQNAIKKDEIDAVVDANFSIAAWVGVDQLAEYFTRKTPMSAEQNPAYPIGIYKYTLVTKANVPEGGAYIESDDDVPGFFKAKWSSEFGMNSQ